jgi:hypothetical protein
MKNAEARVVLKKMHRDNAKKIKEKLKVEERLASAREAQARIAYRKYLAENKPRLQKEQLKDVLHFSGSGRGGGWWGDTERHSIAAKK